MFIIDEKYPYHQIQQFASRITELKKTDKQLFEEHFTGQQSDDFYLGLISGLAGAHQIMESDMSREAVVTTIRSMIAFVADKMTQRGL